MDPYRAIHTTPAYGGHDALERPCVVVAALYQQAFVHANGDTDYPDIRLIAVASDNGEHLEGPLSDFRAVEPTYLGRAQAGEPDHEHEFGGKGAPLLEEMRLVGMVFGCQVPGCAATFTKSGG